MIAPRNAVQCTATAKSTGEQCRRLATLGATVCVRHGAAAGQVRRAAARRVAAAKTAERVEGAFAELMTEMGYDPADTTIDRVVVLGRRLAHAEFMAQTLERLVGDLAPVPELEIHDGVVVTASEAIYGPDHLGDLKAHPLLALLDTWSEKASRYSKLAHDIGIDERRIALDEGERDMMLDFAEALLLAAGPDLGFDYGAEPVRAVLARHARAIEAGSEPLAVGSEPLAGPLAEPGFVAPDKAG